MKIHIVKKGDTLYELAKKYHVDLEKLIAANPQIADPNVLDIGMKVKIPHAPKPVEPPSDYLYKHVVVQGDSLWKLGKAWGVPLPDMIAANPQLKNPNVLMTGETVYIPKLKPHSGSNPNPKADTSVMETQSTNIPAQVESPFMQAEAAPTPIPEMPMPNMPNQAPAMEQPEFMKPMEQPSAPLNNMPPLPDWHHAEKQSPLFEHPAVNPFMQFEMPAVEAGAHDFTEKKDKDHLAEPQLPHIPEFSPAMEMPYWQQSAPQQVSPAMDMPYLQQSAPQQVSPALEMPYWQQPEPQHFATPMDASYLYHPTFPGPVGFPPKDCGCGCGGSKKDHAFGLNPLQDYGQGPAPTALDPYAGMGPYPHHGMPFQPYSIHHPWEPLAGIHGYPCPPGTHYVGGPVMPFSGYQEPFGGFPEKDCGCHDRSKQSEETATVSQTAEAAVKSAPKKSKKSSMRAAISQIIERDRRLSNRAAEKRIKSAPWTGNFR